MQKTTLLLLLLCISLCFVDARSKTESKRMIKGHVQKLRDIKFGHLSGNGPDDADSDGESTDPKTDSGADDADVAPGDEDVDDEEDMYTQTPNNVW